MFERKLETWETRALAFENYRHRTGRRAAVARRHRLLRLDKIEDKNGDKTDDEKASRGAPQTVPQMAWLFLKLGNLNPGNRILENQKRMAGTPARASFELRATDFPSRETGLESLKDGKRYGSPGRARASDTCCRTK